MKNYHLAKKISAMKRNLHKFLAITLLLCFSFEVQAAKNDTLVVGYYPSAPFIIENVTGLSGISVYLWENIQRELKQPYVYKKMTLNEVLKGVASTDIDVTIDPLTITSARSEIMDFSAPYYISSSSVMVRSVSSFQKGMEFIGSFLSLNFFKAVGALFLIVFIFGTLAWVFEHKHNPEEFKPGIKGLWSGIWWSAVTMTTVGYGDKSPKTAGGRIIALIWMFSAIIIISGFTASIASSLTVNQLSWNQNKIEDFKEKKIAVIEKSATESYLRQHFFKNLQSYKSLKECQSALREMEVDAISHDIPQVTYITQFDSLSQYEILPVSYNSQLYAFGFSTKLDDDLKKSITVELLKITESTHWKVLLSEYGLLKE
ncbi:MAG: transporter substrate-binding domain-containing protein [Salinivirgaceae bacterium]|jgi:polar amino acid transport system substrate-binding protein|nr:transporter substrate-binding domain-containing protein [Salinivirgaceae bacterium]